MKGSHKTAQNDTAPTFTPRPLTPEQLNAIPLLCTGMTDAETAAAVGVQRETVWRWRNEVPLFMAELERARQQFISGAVDNVDGNQSCENGPLLFCIHALCRLCVSPPLTTQGLRL